MARGIAGEHDYLSHRESRHTDPDPSLETTNRLCGGSAGLVGITRAAVYPMRNYVYRLVTTSLRLIIPLSLPGPKVTISSPTTFSSVESQEA